MDAKKKLLDRIEDRLTIYAYWVSQGEGKRSDVSEDLYCDLMNIAFGYELQNMNWVQDNFPAIDLGDDDKRLAVQVTSTKIPDKVRKTLKRFFDHGLNQKYDRLIVLIAGLAEHKDEKGVYQGVDLEIWGTKELMKELRKLTLEKLEEVDKLLKKRVSAEPTREPVFNLPLPERRNPVGFLGREDELEWIQRELDEGKTKPVVIEGLGGVGKTALVIQFAETYRKGKVYFTRFQDTFAHTLASLLGYEDCEGENEELKKANIALQHLAEAGEDDLLILDNVDVAGKTWADMTQDSFYKKLRRLALRVIMTTRHRGTGGRRLGNLKHHELQQIFCRHEVSISELEMDELIRAVDGHTMAVDMIARTIRESWGAVQAKEILKAIKDNTLQDGEYDDIENDHDLEQRQIYAHLRALFDVSGITPDGCYALNCATLIPQNGMDAASFREALTGGAVKEIKRLEKCGWVDLKDRTITIHPVIRMVCRVELKPTDEKCEPFLNALWEQYEKKLEISKDYQEDIHKFAQWAICFQEAYKNLPEKSYLWVIRSLAIWDTVTDTYNRRMDGIRDSGIPNKDKFTVDLMNINRGAVPVLNPDAGTQSQTVNNWYISLSKNIEESISFYKELGNTESVRSEHAKTQAMLQKIYAISENYTDPEQLLSDALLQQKENTKPEK